MTSLKRVVIEISSGSDDDNPLVTRRKIRRLRTKPQPQLETEKEHDKAAFEEFLARALPAKLIPADLAAYIHRESNIRLQTAKENGVKLDEIFIGDDCLPTWLGMEWNPEVESLHCAIQNRLLDLQVSQELGELLRNQLVTKGNRKLDEARQLGIDLGDIVIGHCLLAKWTTSTGVEDADNLTAQSIEVPDREGDLADDEMEVQDSEIATPYPHVRSRCDSPQSDAFSFASTTTTVPSPPYMSYGSTSSDSSSDSDFSDNNVDEFGDAISLNNFVDSQPYYEEPDPHVVYDVEIVGGLEGFSDVDLEIYLAEDDEDLDELPEIELAIDREGFEYYFGNEGAVDVEIPGVGVQCTGAISEDNSDESDVEDAESVQENFCAHHSPFEQQQLHSWDEEVGLFDENAMITDSVADNNLASNVFQDIPNQEVPDREQESSVNIEETEYGFKW